MAFKIKTTRTYKQDVTLSITDEEGKNHDVKATATWKLVPEDQLRGDDRSIVEALLVHLDVPDVPIEDDAGNPADATEWAKHDAFALAQLSVAWRDGLVKNSRRRT